jgi:hypothetical protein
MPRRDVMGLTVARITSIVVLETKALSIIHPLKQSSSIIAREMRFKIENAKKLTDSKRRGKFSSVYSASSKIIVEKILNEKPSLEFLPVNCWLYKNW